MIQHETRLRVRYAETDQMGVSYYANYLVWMEIGRTELCRAIGISYRDMERDDGVLFTVAEANCRYHAPARYDDELAVTSRVEDCNSRMMKITYEIRNAATGQTLAKGFTKHVFCGPDMRPRKLPEKYHAAFGVRNSVSR